jgi:hypothetical protein
VTNGQYGMAMAATILCLDALLFWEVAVRRGVWRVLAFLWAVTNMIALALLVWAMWGTHGREFVVFLSTPVSDPLQYGIILLLAAVAWVLVRRIIDMVHRFQRRDVSRWARWLDAEDAPTKGTRGQTFDRQPAIGHMHREACEQL